MKNYSYNYEKAIRANPKIWHSGFIVHNTIKKEIALFCRLINTKNNGSVLDFGCGKSPFRKYFKNYQGADIDLKNKEPDYFIDKLTNKIDSLPNESIQNVISVQVLEHVSDIDLYINEVKRILKKSGYFFIMAPFMYNFHGTDDFARYSKNFFLKNNLFEDFNLIRINFEGNDFIEFIIYNINHFIELFPGFKYFYPLFMINNLLAIVLSSAFRLLFVLLSKIDFRFWQIYQNTFLIYPLQISLTLQKK